MLGPKSGGACRIMTQTPPTCVSSLSSGEIQPDCACHSVFVSFGHFITILSSPHQRQLTRDGSTGAGSQPLFSDLVLTLSLLLNPALSSQAFLPFFDSSSFFFFKSEEMLTRCFGSKQGQAWGSSHGILSQHTVVVLCSKLSLAVAAEILWPSPAGDGVDQALPSQPH